MSFINIHKVSRKYAETVALSQVSFQVNEAELFGVIGPDGAGKTTLFRIMATLLLADEGKVSLFGHDVRDDYKILRNHIGCMPGKFSLYTDLSVLENLEFYATVFGTSIEENYDLIKDIYSQIEPFKHRKAGQLSGGMKQKLALSCALIHAPRLLLLDEPTTGVDAVSRKEFWEMLQALKTKNITIVVSTPYMDEAALCDRVALLTKGEILAIATPDDLNKSFSGILYEIKAADLYTLKNKINQNFGSNSAFLFGQSIHFHPQCEVYEEEILRWFQQEQISYDQLTPIKAGTEDCFIQLMTQKN